MSKTNTVLLLGGAATSVAMALTGVALRALHLSMTVWWDTAVYFVLAFTVTHRLVLKRWPRIRRQEMCDPKPRQSAPQVDDWQCLHVTCIAASYAGLRAKASTFVHRRPRGVAEEGRQVTDGLANRRAPRPFHDRRSARCQLTSGAARTVRRPVASSEAAPV